MTEVRVAFPSGAATDAASSCTPLGALPQSSSSDDAGQSTQTTTSPTSTSSASLADTIETMFSLDHLRLDHTLLSGMDGRMLIAVDALLKHPRLASVVPPVAADDIVAVGRGTKRVVLEEYPIGVFRMGPLPQAHPKSKCTITLQCRPLNNSGATTSAAAPSTAPLRRLSALIPNKEAAQSFLQSAHNGGHASQCSVLHYYDCPSTHAIFLTFADERVAKQAFLDAQQKTVDNMKVDVKLRIEQGHPAPHYSNQGHPAGHYPNQGTSSGAAPQPKRASPMPPNPPTPPLAVPALPPQFPLPTQPHHNPFVTMMALGLFPFMMPPFGMAPPAGFMPPNAQQAGTPQPALTLANGTGTTKRASVTTLEAPASTAKTNGTGCPADHQSSPLSASTTSGGSQLSVPTTPATPSTELQRHVGTKYRLDPYSNRGRVVEDALLPASNGPQEDAAVACPAVTTVVGPPQAIDVYCLPSTHDENAVEGPNCPGAAQLSRMQAPLRRGGGDTGPQRQRMNRHGMEGGFCRANTHTGTSGGAHGANKQPTLLPDASFPPLADALPPAASGASSVHGDTTTTPGTAAAASKTLNTGVPSVELAKSPGPTPPSKASYASILLRSAVSTVQHDAS